MKKAQQGLASLIHSHPTTLLSQCNITLNAHTEMSTKIPIRVYDILWSKWGGHAGRR